MVGVVLLRPSRAGKSGNGPHAAHGPRVAQPCSSRLGRQMCPTTFISGPCWVCVCRMGPVPNARDEITNGSVVFHEHIMFGIDDIKIQILLALIIYTSLSFV